MKILFYLFIAVILLSSCTKIISESHPYSNLLESTKQHYYYKNGSYWIYRDSISGREDSCYVYSSRLDTFNANGLFVEHLIVRMKQYPLGAVINDSVFYQFETYPRGSFYFSGSKKYFSDNNELDFFSTKLPLSEDSAFSSDWNYTTSVKENKEFVLLGNTFTKVFEISTNKTSTTNNGRTIYFNEEYGLIKMRIHTEDVYHKREDKVWELQRCKIVK